MIETMVTVLQNVYGSVDLYFINDVIFVILLKGVFSLIVDYFDDLNLGNRWFDFYLFMNIAESGLVLIHFYFKLNRNKISEYCIGMHASNVRQYVDPADISTVTAPLGNIWIQSIKALKVMGLEIDRQIGGHSNSYIPTHPQIVCWV